jgi:hypothetical protein
VSNWQWSIGPWKAGVSQIKKLAGAGGPQMAMRSASSRTLKLKLLDPSTIDVALDGTSDEASILEDLITDLWVYRDGAALFRGRMVGPTTDTIIGGKHDTKTTFVDYRGVLGRRQLYADKNWTTIEQATVVWDLVSDTQGQAGGNIGIVQNTFPSAWAATGVTRTARFKAGDYLWDSIKKLGAMNGGFDFDIDMNLLAYLYYPQRGVDNGVVLDYGGVVTELPSRTFDPGQYANALRQSGATGVTPTITTAPDIASAPEGRWDAAFGDTALTTTQMVADTAAVNLATASAPLPSWSLKLARGAWGGPGHFWLGDYVVSTVNHGRLDETEKVRVYEIDITLDENDAEDVTVIVGDVALDPRTVLHGISKRLAYLMKQ